MKIEALKLFTPNFEAQLHFYEEQLGLEVKRLKKDVFRVELGFSILDFQQDEQAKPTHFALHIPAQSHEESLVWLQERVEVLDTKDGKIMDFPAWEAKSLYFYDADRNIVEFIARKNLYKPLSEAFSAKSILGISEIGVATSNVEDVFNFMNTHFGLLKFSGDYEKFCAVGDDEGLFIVIDKEGKSWIPVNDATFAANFEIKFTIKNAFFGALYKDESFTLL